MWWLSVVIGFALGESMLTSVKILASQTKPLQKVSCLLEGHRQPPGQRFRAPKHTMSSPQDRPPPTTAAIAIATGIIAALLGYFIGQGSSLGLFGGSSPSTKKQSWPNSYDVKVHADSSDEESLSASEDLDDDGGKQEHGGLKNFSNSGEEFKLVLVVRTDLGMTKGLLRLPCYL